MLRQKLGFVSLFFGGIEDKNKFFLDFLSYTCICFNFNFDNHFWWTFLHWNHQWAPLVTKTDKYRDRSTNLFISKQHSLQNPYLVTILKGPTKIMWTSYLFREITNFRYACFPRILPYKDLYKFQFQGRLTCYHWHNNQPKN